MMFSMMAKHSILTLLMVSLCSIYGSAQTQEFYHFETNNGLNNNSVYSIIQDAKGYIWIGTKDGVNKFDGIRFSSIPIISNHNAKNDIITSLHLYQDKEKNLWLGTEKGLFLYDSMHNNFNIFSNHLIGNISSVTEDTAKGFVYIINNNMLYRINRQNNTITYIRINETLHTLTGINNNTLWLANSYGEIVRYNLENNTYKKYNVFNQSPQVISYGIEKLYFLNDSTLLIGTTNQGAKSFNIHTEKYNDFLSENPDGGDLYVRDFLKISDEELWIATERGIFKYNLTDNAYERFVKNPNNIYSISDNAVYCLYQDTENGIWAGTYFGGINYAPRKYQYFEKFFEKQTENSLKGNVVREIVEDKNSNLWIGTEDNGLNKLDVKNNTFTHFVPNTKNSISSTNIHGLLAIDNELWVGTFDHGLDVINIHTGKIIRHYNYGNEENSLKSNFIHSIENSNDGKIILATSNGLYYYNKEYDNFTQVPQTPLNTFYSALLTDRQNNIWAGTFSRGIYCINTENNSVEKIELKGKNNQDIFLSKKITDIFQDTDNIVWIGTESGLFSYNITTKAFKEYAVSNGLPSNFIYSIQEDDNKVLWISTSNGLVAINLKNHTTRIYDNNSGILFNQFNYKSSYKDKNGFLYFGGIKGLIKFNPALFSIDTFRPPLYITTLHLANGTDVNIKKSGTVYLNHNQASFNINFAALEYTSPKSIQYAYKLEGSDYDWDTLQTNRTVYYNNLPHGNYIFNVTSTNAAGKWIDNLQQIKIIIRPPFYKSRLAYILYIIAILTTSSLIIYFIRERTREKIRQKNAIKKIEDEKKIYEAKIDFFTQVAHEIRTPLTLIKGPLEKIIRSEELPLKLEKNVRIMERNTNRLLDLTNDLLNFRESETSKFSLNFKNVNFTKLTEELIMRFQNAFDSKNIQLNFTATNHNIIIAADEEALTKIISNLLNNAVKYGESKVDIFISDEDKNLVIAKIYNDGKTIPDELADKIFEPFFRYRNTKEPGTGIGMALARSLTELHGGSLTYDGSNGINSFTLQLPNKL